MTVDLSTRLLAEIAHVESEARDAAHGGAGIWTRDTERYGHIQDEAGEIVVYDEGRPTEAQAEHIALNDPNSVLRLCQAHREIVRQFQRAWDKRNTGDERERVIRQAHAVVLIDVLHALAGAYGLKETS